MAAQINLYPLRDGATDEWRAFVAELSGPRRIEWAQSQRRRGIRREVISLASGQPDQVLVYTESADHDQAVATLASSDDPFDHWYLGKLSALFGDRVQTEVVFDSSPKPGPWRGWRR